MSRIQVITIIINCIFIGYIARLITKGKLREEYAIVWCICTVILILFSFWTKGLNLMSKIFRPSQPDIYRLHFFNTDLFAAPFGGKFKVAPQHHPLNTGNGHAKGKDEKS